MYGNNEREWIYIHILCLPLNSIVWIAFHRFGNAYYACVYLRVCVCVCVITLHHRLSHHHMNATYMHTLWHSKVIHNHEIEQHCQLENYFEILFLSFSLFESHLALSSDPHLDCALFLTLSLSTFACTWYRFSFSSSSTCVMCTPFIKSSTISIQTHKITKKQFLSNFIKICF